MMHGGSVIALRLLLELCSAVVSMGSLANGGSVSSVMGIFERGVLRFLPLDWSCVVMDRCRNFLVNNNLVRSLDLSNFLMSGWSDTQWVMNNYGIMNNRGCDCRRHLLGHHLFEKRLWDFNIFHASMLLNKLIMDDSLLHNRGGSMVCDRCLNVLLSHWGLHVPNLWAICTIGNLDQTRLWLRVHWLLDDIAHSRVDIASTIRFIEWLSIHGWHVTTTDDVGVVCFIAIFGGNVDSGNGCNNK